MLSDSTIRFCRSFRHDHGPLSSAGQLTAPPDQASGLRDLAANVLAIDPALAESATVEVVVLSKTDLAAVYQLLVDAQTTFGKARSLTLLADAVDLLGFDRQEYIDDIVARHERATDRMREGGTL
jgi:hypothetical protein